MSRHTLQTTCIPLVNWWQQLDKLVDVTKRVVGSVVSAGQDEVGSSVVNKNALSLTVASCGDTWHGFVPYTTWLVIGLS